MPARRAAAQDEESLSRLIDKELEQHPLHAAAAQQAPNNNQASSGSWVAQHLGKAMASLERDSRRKAPPRPNPLRSSVAVVLGWVLVGVLACAGINKLLGPTNIHLVVGPYDVHVVGPSNQEEKALSFTAPQPEKAPEALAPFRAPEALAPFRAPARPRTALPCMTRMHDGKAFLFQSPERPDRKAFVCLNEKAGSTTWKLALLRAGPHTKYHNLTVSPHTKGADAEPHCGEHSEDAAVPRFAMVRNPYSRLLSGYMDKCVHDPSLLPGSMRNACRARKENSKNGKGWKDAAALFPKFVEAVINEDPDKLNRHFGPQSGHCDVNAGYDYYLPTEQIAHWYEPFVAALDLEEALGTGWNVSTRYWHNDGSECFYHPPGLGCDGEPLGAAGAGPVAMGSSHATDWHATGSDGRLDEFYTPELARAVSEWLKADLEEFGYPAWDGVDGAGYLRRISTPQK